MKTKPMIGLFVINQFIRNFFRRCLLAIIIPIISSQATSALAQSTGCETFSDAGSWQVSEWQAEVVQARERADRFSSLQGMAVVEGPGGSSRLLVTHGGEANATMLDLQLKPLLSKGLSASKDGSRFPLLADVASGDGGNMWTNYRAPEVIWTDPLIDEAEIVTLGGEFTGLVGIAYAPEIKAFLVPARHSNRIAMLWRANGDWETHVSELAVPESLQTSAAYDIQVHGACATIVYREDGVIATFSTNSLLGDQPTRVARAFPGIGFNRPQHAQWHENGRFYVIETDAHRVTVLSPDEETIWHLNLPRRVFRGLAVAPDGRLFISGFSDEPPLNENNTGVFELSLPDTLRASP